MKTEIRNSAWLTDGQIDEQRGKWANPLLSQVLVETVFKQTKNNFASEEFTRDLFNPLPDLLIVLAATLVAHSILEFTSGEHKTIKFEGERAYCNISRLYPHVVVACLVLIPID